MKAYNCMHATEKFWQVCSVKGISSASKDQLILPFLPCQVRGKLSRNLQTYGSQDISGKAIGLLDKLLIPHLL